MSPPWRVTPARFGMLGYEGSVFVVTYLVRGFVFWCTAPLCANVSWSVCDACRKDSLKKKQEFTGYDMYDLIMDKFDVSRACV